MLFNNSRCCYFTVLILSYFCLTKVRIMVLRLETIVKSFLHLKVLICEDLINHFSKRFFMMLLFVYSFTGCKIHIQKRNIFFLVLLQILFIKAKGRYRICRGKMSHDESNPSINLCMPVKLQRIILI